MARILTPWILFLFLLILGCGDLSVLVSSTKTEAGSHDTTPSTPSPAPVLLALLSGQPIGSSSQSVLNIQISGINIETYQYKLGPASSTNCNLLVGYSNPLSIVSPITDTLTGFPDGLIRLCVIGINSSGQAQSLDTPTIYEWSKTTLGGSCPNFSLGAKWAANSMNNTANAQAIEKVGNYVYLGVSDFDADKGLHIIDVTDPTNLSRVGFFPTQSGPAMITGWGDDTLGLDIKGSYAYLATYMGGLVIVDISTPANPTFVGKLDISSESWDVVALNNTAFVANYAGLRSVDITNKPSPSLLQTLNRSNSPRSLLLKSNTELIVGTASSVDIIDITNPSNMTLIGTYPLSQGAAQSLALNGNYLYVANKGNSSVLILNISDPANPVLARRIPNIGLSGSGAPRGVRISGNWLTVAAYDGTDGGVYVYDISDPINPTYYGSIATPDAAWDAIKSGNDIFVADTTTQLQVVSGCFTQKTLQCPVGYVNVPGSSRPGSRLSNFCVSKYHMKATLKSNDQLVNGKNLGIATIANYRADSRADDQPWGGVDLASARSLCSGLGNKYHLITNAEWMTIARSIETTNANWSGGVVGNGHIPTGHSDGFAISGQDFLAASALDSDACFGTNNVNCLSGASTDFWQKRTFYLENNEIIWDFAGNMNSWVDVDGAGSGLSYNVSSSSWQEFHQVNGADMLSAYPTMNFLNARGFLPVGDYGASVLLDSLGFGIIRREVNPSTPSVISGRGVFRGGHFAEVTTWERRQGIYSAWLLYDTTPTWDNLGFRCVYDP